MASKETVRTANSGNVEMNRSTYNEWDSVQLSNNNGHGDAKAMAHGSHDGKVSSATIPGKDDLDFLRHIVDIVIKDGLIGAMDIDQ